VTDSRPPASLLTDATLAVLGTLPQPRDGRTWLVEWRQEQGLLRQTALASNAAERTAGDMAWLHGFLNRLASTGFPAPRPLPAFGGRSWTIRSGSLWQLTSFLPGTVVGWSPVPPLAEIGALLARYHLAVAALEPTAQRPSALPLAEVPAILLSGQVEASGVSRDQAASIRSLAADLAADLAEAGRAGPRPLVIHGDFTCHNVVATGTPPAAAGVIDFELAHVESPLADVAYGLWRSGRPRQEADCVDAARLEQFLRGYVSVRPVTADQARVISVYLRGRGLQMIAKRVSAGRPDTGMLAQVAWLSAHSGAVAETLAAALEVTRAPALRPDCGGPRRAG
jgi:Ser/Thr protein kinase RdoA (MazF antagonist)